jgi:hypothetical protein
MSLATRKARILRLAAAVIDAAGHPGRPLTAPDVPRLLGRAVPERDAHEIAKIIQEIWGPPEAGRMGRDAETDCLRGHARWLVASSRRRGRGGAR